MTNKYNIGDKVWFIKGVDCFYNKEITAIINTGEIFYSFDTAYSPSDVEDFAWYNEKNVVKTKEDLLKSL